MRKDACDSSYVKTISARTYVKIIEPVTWCAKNRDMVLKIMGVSACDEAERDAIKGLLMEDGHFELLAAMLLCDAVQNPQPQDENPLDALQIDPSNGDSKAFALKRWGQLRSFLRWCDAKEKALFREGMDDLNMLRLLYLAACVGYNALTTSLAANLKADQIDHCFEAMEKYQGRETLLFQRWIQDFYAKQPEGKDKKKLGKRMMRFAPQSVRPLRLSAHRTF